ncbi:HNH endonuclease signature motif containing protein [uncultured Ornithinimicrobium sp.]|uniref:HNH endonuclease signature motif containing protein n=1 Tax=uncultured Ornithinimicrobium sp. TaxID=259307 RepID=UPI0025921358|nr:HNH endonuclease signature motif containing protein [uncultured Ornithinimicrobium sp.]
MGQTWGGEVLRTTAGAVVRQGALPASRLPGERVLGSLREAGREAVMADLAAGDVALVQDADLDAALGATSTVAAAVERARVRLAVEATARGLPTAAGMGLTDWLGLRCPELSRGVLQDLVRLAQAGQEAVHAPLVQGVLTGGMPLARAARLHRALTRIRGALAPGDYDQAVGLLADAGCNPVFEEADITRVTNRLLAACLPEKDHEDRRTAQQQLRDVHESSLADGSVKRIILTFGQDGDYQAVRAILRSPLAAPATAEETAATGQQDTRTPGQRRYDALMTVLRRGVAGTQGEPTTPKATLLVTMDLDTLRRDLAATGGRVPGCGTTLEGDLVAAESVRRLACEADLIPLVLGGDGEVVDQGRRKRLVTPAQRVRLAVRDQGCTIPGCTVPATWCDAHHVLPWANGGRSDLSNYALLCPRHHTWVHEHALTATITAHGVIWHLR